MLRTADDVIAHIMKDPAEYRAVALTVDEVLVSIGGGVLTARRITEPLPFAKLMSPGIDLRPDALAALPAADAAKLGTMAGCIATADSSNQWHVTYYTRRAELVAAWEEIAAQADSDF